MDLEVERTLTKSKRKETTKSYLVAFVFIAPFIISFIFFFLVPLGYGLVTSFMRYNPYDPSGNRFIGFNNYIKIFTPGNDWSDTFWEAFGTTALFCVVAVPCLIIIPFLLAVAINTKPPGHKIFRAIIYLPSVLSMATMGAIFVALFSTGNKETAGLINSLFGLNIDWLGTNSRWVVIFIASIWWNSGQNFVIISAALKNVDKNLYEASSLDGCGKIKQFFSVTVPGIKEQLVVCLFTTIIAYFGLYAQVKVLATGLAKYEVVSPVQMIQERLTDTTTYANSVGMITAIGFVFALLLIVISGIQMILTKDKKGGHKYADGYKAYIEENR